MSCVDWWCANIKEIRIQSLMSLHGILELVIVLDKFKNIDLFHQGLYQLRLEVYHCGSNSFAS
jgi:hypothetical protein